MNGPVIVIHEHKKFIKNLGSGKKIYNLVIFPNNEGPIVRIVIHNVTPWAPLYSDMIGTVVNSPYLE
jgi:hypothetical protein